MVESDAVEPSSPPKSPPTRRALGVVRGLASALVALLALAIAAGFLGLVHPFFDSVAHFRAHLAAVTTVAALPLLLSRRWLQGVVAWAVAGVAIVSVLRPSLMGGPARADFAPYEVTEPVHTLLSVNLRYDNPLPDAFIASIRDDPPEILALSEVSDGWADKLRSLLNLYPYQIRCGRGEPKGGNAVLAKFPFAQGGFGQCSDDGDLAIAPLSVDGAQLDVAAIHLHWPWPGQQATQIEGFLPRLAALPPRSVVAGDLNATPWSQAVRRMTTGGALAAMPSPGPTWLFAAAPAALRRWIGLPIDQAFVKDGVVLHEGRRVLVAGSDHMGVLVTFSMKADEKTAGPILTASSATAAGD